MNIKQLNIRQKVISILRRNKKEESEEVEEEMLEDNFDLDDLMNYVSNRIVGQDEAIRTLISNILYNQLLLNEISEQETLEKFQFCWKAPLELVSLQL